MSRFVDHVRDSGKSTAGGECACCDRPATHFVRYAGSYMRGEDDIYHVCHRHEQMANNNLGKFFGHMRSRDRFVSAKAGGQ